MSLGIANQLAAQLKRAAETSQHTLFPDMRANGKNKAQRMEVKESDQMADGFKKGGRERRRAVVCCMDVAL